MSEEKNPFNELSQIFIDNQRNFNSKCKNLLERTNNFVARLSTVSKQLNEEPFSADLNLYLNIEEEARLVVMVAKEVEFQRDQILKTIELLKSSNTIKLNK